MKTVRLQITSNADFYDDTRIFSSIVRMAYNRFQEGLSEKEVRSYVSQRFNHNSWFIQSAIKKASNLYATTGKNKIIFGGKRNLQKYLKGIISKKQYLANRRVPLCIIGELLRSGNRLINFNLQNNVITYKPSRIDHREIKFCPVKKKLARELAKVQELAKQKKICKKTICNRS